MTRKSSKTESDATNNNKIRVKTIMVLACVFLLLSIGLTWYALPKLANHFNFALPLENPAGLPYHISFNNRTYLNNTECAGEGWCGNSKPECRTQESLTQQNQWPLKQVGEVPTFFGAAHPIMIPASYTHTTVLYVPYGSNGCYLNFGLEGGP